MMKKDGKYMASDYDKGTTIKIFKHKGLQYVKLDDIIKWLKDNRENSLEIETDWLIKVFVRIKNDTK
jgi:hypothetical protein